MLLSTTLRRGRRGLILTIVGATMGVALFAACDASEAEDDPLGVGTPAGSMGSDSTDGSSGAIDRQAILGNLAEVQAMLEDTASRFDDQVITDVDFANNRLTVTASEEVQELEDAQELCQDLSEAVAAVDLTIIVRNETGAELAACTFRG